MQSKLHFITLGQGHTHKISGKLLTKDTVVVFRINTDQSPELPIRELFGLEYSTYYSEDNWNPDHIKYYPDGYVCIDWNMSHSQIEEYLTQRKQNEILNPSLNIN